VTRAHAPAIQLSFRYSSSRIACLRASLTSLAVLRSSASIRRLVVGAVGSEELHAGQTLAKPGLFGFSSNSSAQTEQIFVGKAIAFYDTTLITPRGSGYNADTVIEGAPPVSRSLRKAWVFARWRPFSGCPVRTHPYSLSRHILCSVWLRNDKDGSLVHEVEFPDEGGAVIHVRSVAEALDADALSTQGLA
jgi:hypothetical protein